MLFISGVLSFFFVNSSSLKDFSNYMTGFATILLAILTGIYVITTNSQLNVMKRQLKEMEFSRNLQTQPLPIFKDVECFLEPPKIFIEGCTENKKIVVTIKTDIIGKIENIGIGSAVAIDFIPILTCKNPNGKRIEDIFTRLDFLEERGIEEFEVQFNTDDEILESFLEIGTEQLPILELTVYYKNVLGAFFKAVYNYKIYPFDEDEDIIKKWLKSIKMFDIDFSEKIRNYDSQVKINPKESETIFDEIKSEFGKGMQDSNLEAPIFLIPGSFNVKPISDEEFNFETGKESVFYGTRLGPGEKKDWLEKKKKVLID